tara:strand:+ start:4183 stop:4623 length:441 start_codon:yes stop_codon:yes gene_type:complete
MKLISKIFGTRASRMQDGDITSEIQIFRGETAEGPFQSELSKDPFIAWIQAWAAVGKEAEAPDITIKEDDFIEIILLPAEIKDYNVSKEADKTTMSLTYGENIEPGQKLPYLIAVIPKNKQHIREIIPANPKNIHQKAQRMPVRRP